MYWTIATKRAKSASTFALLLLTSIWTIDAACGATIVDLRFAGGGKMRDGALLSTFQVEVWVTVTGANATPDEGLLYVYGSIQSTQLGGGMVRGSVISNQGAGLFSTSPPQGQPGTPQQISPDDVGDWGTTASNNTNTIKYNSILNNGLDPVYATSPGVIANVLSNGVEFLVGTFNFTITDYTGANAITELHWVKGTGTIPGPHSSRLDGSAAAVTSAATYLSPAQQNSVVFGGIPEPLNLGWIGLTAVLFLRRRSV